MSEIKIPKITLPTIDIPDAPYFTKHKLKGKLPGCYLYHRDLENTRNPSLLISDKRGTYTICPNGEIPSYEPIRYDPAQIIYTEPDPINTPTVKTNTKVAEPKTKKDNKIVYEPCPPEKPQFRIGDYRNDKRIERLVKYERSIDGSCNPIWEKVPFRESFTGTPQVLISTTLLGVVAGGSALLAPLIKKIISEIFKKIKKQLTNKKDTI